MEWRINMKLKNVLVLTFLTLTLIPIIVVSLLLYKSGFDLSKESYTRNLIESINVQVDYISQTMENNMISDYRFASRNFVAASDNSKENQQYSDLFINFQSYLESSEDKVTVCMLLDKNNAPIYTIGEKAVLDTINNQLPPLSELKNQTIMEFDLGNGTYGLGIITPVHGTDNTYAGSLISIYDKTYIFKIISSYYELVDTSTYICRESGEIINFRGLSDEKRNDTVEQALDKLVFTSEGNIDMRIGNIPVTGYYKNIHNSPWFLVGFIDDELIYTFTNQFVLVYILIIIGVLIADVFLSFYFSQKVVEPINKLIKVMEGYQNNLNSNELKYNDENGYYETQYLQTKFFCLMKTILLVQHNFEGVYQLYQSNDMDDTNIDIDVKNQTIHSNKEGFQNLINESGASDNDCIVEKFIKCFCEEDQFLLTNVFENMRDEHLSVTREIEVCMYNPNQRWFHTLVVPMYENDRLSRLFVQLRDISSFKKQEIESSEQAKRDSLTGLYNRSGFYSSVEKSLKSLDNSDLHGLLFIDMNYFKMVNDNFGHSAGDDLLSSVGKKLLETIGLYGIVCRYGGDEFAVFIPNTSIEDITKLKEDLNKLLIYPFDTGKISFVVSASIGVSTWINSSSNTLQSMLKHADESMYKAKRDFKQETKK